MSLLTVSELSVSFTTDDGVVDVLDRVSLSVDAGETLGVVGESGCGKSVTAMSIMGLLPKPSGEIKHGEIHLDGLNLVGLDSSAMSSIRGGRISMIFQEPMTALNPVQRVGRQLAESYRLHHSDATADSTYRASMDLMNEVGIPAPERRLQEYPHQLSGGMRQRVMIAMALASRPEVLIADEPTTALDVTIQAQILELMRSLQNEYGMAIIFITHDLGVIAELADRVCVMYAGRVAEQATVSELYATPRHPYTRGLLTSIPRLENEPKTILPTIPGVVPQLTELPDGCRFSNRCTYATDKCHATQPDIEAFGNEREISCHRWRDLVESELV